MKDKNIVVDIIKAALPVVTAIVMFAEAKKKNSNRTPRDPMRDAVNRQVTRYNDQIVYDRLFHNIVKENPDIY